MPKHLWLVPITQAIQLQMVRNAPYADHIVRFEPTLSPVNLAPSAAAIDLAGEWGRNSVDKAIPVTTALLQPTWWEGDRPAAGEAETVAAAEVGGMADERGDGRDPVASEPVRALAQPPPHLRR